jgi:small-conductance mechanosensitive channel
MRLFARSIGIFVLVSWYLSTPLVGQHDVLDEQVEGVERMQQGLAGMEDILRQAAGGQQQPASLVDSLKAGNMKDASSMLLALILSVLIMVGRFASVFFGFWLLALIARKMIIRAGRLNAVDGDLAVFIGRAAKTALLIIGAICGLGTIGVNVTALIAALGLTGFALGFALKDVVSNVVAGVLILIYRPVQTGEHVKVKSFEGLILSTDLRYTVLQTGEQMIYVPNSIMFTDAITVDRKSPEPNPEPPPVPPAVTS